MAYEKMKCVPFGKMLLETGDLDPIYIMLWDAKLSRAVLDRWLLGYFFFYHAGVSSMLAKIEGPGFFNAVEKLVGSLCPRGTERRHFRGTAAKDCARWFQTHYDGGPEDVVEELRSCGTLQEVLKAVDTWPQFGPWMGFKIADMLERVRGQSISFPDDCLQFYRTPKQGAEQLCKAKGWDWEKVGLQGVVQYLIGKFSKYKAPPRYDRPVGVQEVETILCKWHSHLSGHYPPGKDTHEIREGLEGWGKLADKLAKHLPKGK